MKIAAGEDCIRLGEDCIRLGVDCNGPGCSSAKNGTLFVKNSGPIDH